MVACAPDMASTSDAGVGDCATALAVTDALRNASAVVGPMAAIRTLSQCGTSAWGDGGGIAVRVSINKAVMFIDDSR